MHIPSQTSFNYAPCNVDLSRTINLHPSFQNCTIRPRPWTLDPWLSVRQNATRASPQISGDTFHPTAPTCFFKPFRIASHSRSNNLSACHSPPALLRSFHFSQIANDPVLLWSTLKPFRPKPILSARAPTGNRARSIGESSESGGFAESRDNPCSSHLL